MAKIGYARVSSSGQSLEVQIAKLTAYGCLATPDDIIFQEKKSGTSTSDRSEWKSCNKHLRSGDTLVITKLDRLARSTLDLTNIADDLSKRNIELVVLDQNIDTSTPTGKLLFNMLASIAEFENAIRKERQLDGVQKAKDNGVVFGAKAKLTDEQVELLRSKRAAGVLIKDLINEFKISKASIYRLLSSPQ